MNWYLNLISFIIVLVIVILQNLQIKRLVKINLELIEILLNKILNNDRK